MSTLGVAAAQVAMPPPVHKRGGRRPVWDGAPLVCQAVRSESANVKTFTLAPSDGSRIKFEAGQNLTLEWVLDGEAHHRTFTIASSPAQTSHVELTIKAHGGRIVDDLHRRLMPGESVRAYGPGGRFGLAFSPAKRVLMVSAGSGITPMMSMLRMVRDRRYDTDITLVHAARTPADILFGQELFDIAARRPNVTVTLVPSRVAPGVGWIGPRGRLSRRLLHALAPDAREREVFLCGPEPFADMVRRALRAEGVAAANIHEERFVARAAPPPPPAVKGPSADVSLTLARRGRTVPGRSDATLYAQLREAGVVVPTGCRSGICGTCKVRLTAGEVAMAHQGGLSPKEEAAGVVLACCSYPRTPVTLDV